MSRIASRSPESNWYGRSMASCSPACPHALFVHTSKNEGCAVSGQDTLNFSHLSAFELRHMCRRVPGHGRSSASGSAALIIITLIGEPSDSNWSSYFLPFPSVAIQETLDTCCAAKFPICLHVPVDGSTDGIGSPSSLGLWVDCNSIRVHSRARPGYPALSCHVHRKRDDGRPPPNRSKGR